MAERKPARDWDKRARQKRQERANKEWRESQASAQTMPAPGINVPQRSSACPSCRGDVVWLANRDKWQCLRASCRQSFPGWDLTRWQKRPN